MKKYLPTILTLAVLLIVVGGIFALPHTALAVKAPADTSTTPSGTSLLMGISKGAVSGIFANFSYLILSITSWLVTIAGTFLSISVNLTMHIQEIFFTKGSDSSIQTVWIVIRDIASIFIIFSLLYYSIMIILGQEKGKLQSLIVNIFIAGLLINFSLFFTKVMVDASNLVSLQFYNAITPGIPITYTATSVFEGGGLSDIFMQSLRIPTIYNNGALKSEGSAVANIAFATVGGIIMMVTAAFSFLGAAIAFTARTAIILFVMALSPFYFAGIIFPEVKKKVSNKLLGLFMGQLIFMPVYLFLLYVSLRLISDPTFTAIFNAKSASGDPGFLGSMIGVALQYTIAIIFINAPLLAAIQLGAVGMKWVPSAKDVSGRVSGFLGRNTLGRAGRALGESYDTMAANGTFLGSKTIAKYGGKVMRYTNISQGVRGGLANIEGSKYGSQASLASKEKEEKERTREVAKVARTNMQGAGIKSFLELNGKHTTTQLDDFRKVVGGIDAKELQDIDFDKLKNPSFASSIPSSKFDSLIKELTPTQQQELKDAREKGFKDILATHGADYLINTALKGKPQDIAKLPTDVLITPDVAMNLDPATLRKMVDENVGRETRDKIRVVIEGRHGIHTLNRTTPPSQLKKSFDYLTSPAGGIF